MQKRTLEEVRKWLKDQNITQAQWARENGYTGQEVNSVLTGRAKCQYGRTREIAIKLNLTNRVFLTTRKLQIPINYGENSI